MTSTLATTKPTLWPQCPVPQARGTAWQWQITTLRQLSGLRTDLRARLGSAGCDAATGDGDPVSERILLALDELASNALRHGGDPVHARVVATAEGWLIDVSDGATERGPQPAVGRDPAMGGMGLYLVAELTAGRGWAVVGGRKHVWASLPAMGDVQLQRPSGPGRWAALTRTVFSQGGALANARRAVARDLRAAAQREEAARALADAPRTTMAPTGDRQSPPVSGRPAAYTGERPKLSSNSS